MGYIKDKLNYFEKNLSVKHLARDLIGLQLLLLGSAIAATIIFLLIVNHAVQSSNPEQVIQTAEKTTDWLFWFFYIGMNLLIIFFGSKAKLEANKIKVELIEKYDKEEEE